MNRNKFAAGLLCLLSVLLAASCQEDELAYDFQFDVLTADGAAVNGTQTLNFSDELTFQMTAKCVADVSVDAPEGWSADVSVAARTITVFSPEASDADAEVSGVIAFTAESIKGETKTVTLSVEAVDGKVTFAVSGTDGDNAFLYGEKRTYPIKASNVAEVDVEAPEGWIVTADLSASELSVTAPARDAAASELEGEIELVPSSARGTKGEKVSFSVAVSVLAPSMSFNVSSVEDAAFGSETVIKAVEVVNVSDLVVVSSPEGWSIEVDMATASATVTAPSFDAEDIDGEGEIVFRAVSPSGDEQEYVIPVSLIGINGAADFLAFAEAVNNAADLSGYMYEGEVVLNADVDLSDYPYAVFVTETFTGNFNGKGNTVTLAISTDEEFSSLFKRIEAPAAIRNLNLAGSITNSGHNVKVAGLTCYSKGATYENVNTSIALSQTGTGDTSNGKFGSLVSDEEGNGTYRNCHNSGALTVSSARYVGGLIGSIWDNTAGLMEDCSNTGNMTCSFSETIDMAKGLYGGVVGTTIGSDWDFIRCFNTGDIRYSLTASEIRAVGGFSSTLFGYFEDCYNTGDVVNEKGTAASKATRRIGGFGGASWQDNGYVCHLKGCYNTGNVSDITNYIGGFIGLAEDGSADNYHKFEDCYNSGNVTCLSDNSVSDAFGGFAGTLYSVALLQNCSNSGKVVGYTRRCAGGLVGRAADNIYIVDCANSGDVYAGAVSGQLSKDWSPVVGGICGIAGDGSTVTIQTSRNTGKVTAMVQWEEAVASVYACEGTTRALLTPDGGYADKNVCDDATKEASASATVVYIPISEWSVSVPEGWL